MAEYCEQKLNRTGIVNWKIDTDAASSKWENHPDSESLKVLVLDNPTTKEVKWSVSFKK